MTKCKEYPLDIPVQEEYLEGDIRVHDLLIILATCSTPMASKDQKQLCFIVAPVKAATANTSDAQELRGHFSTIASKPWLQPIRFLVVHVGRNETGRAAHGVKWFDAICFGVFQFCLVKALGAIMKWITEAADIMVIEILSLIAAILCLLQFYVATKDQLARHRPLLKFTSIKVVIFVFYVQKFIFSQLTKEGDVIKPSPKVSYPSWSVGMPNTLLCA
ncbi:organic solute transporter Ostalpha-domain-containing protein [Aspergillus arachidicola]|uniref:Organic solute transporter Ostalpha-domain-containing protein n=1 Tax=Aspergillus arachidicola TaxID=656916 RepID=A0A5N6XWA2_9EURO|nr:organic solute transporter Ostalpha-domain-containing protein [Aspergillus arachidicola]